ncbi:SAF domain-containing protein [Actinomyces bowdenii]|uniref:SAF domain-containing protein n=1 Tax=Actinomyces bowdenii TaxID=131109 RepID=UPI001FBA2C87|nr:SAF domain-containing protein [Actinomyces bowdenii]
MPRPSLLLWRYRHVVVALCLGGAVLLALGVLRPAAQPGQEVLVVARALDAGHVLTREDVERRSLPLEALPSAGLAGEEVIGLRSAIALEPGTVLTTSMTSAALTRDLDDQERVVQVPVEVGAQLAQPGARVDVVGRAPAPGESGALVPVEADGEAGTGAEQAAGSSGAKAGEGPGASPPTGAPGAFGQPAHRVLSSGARVISVQSIGEADQWTSGRKVTLVTLAVPASDATLVVGAATNGELGIVLSP